MSTESITDADAKAAFDIKQLDNPEVYKFYRKFDLPIIFILFFLIGLSVMLHYSLTAGDWDYWIDWRDRRFWPLVTPISLLILTGGFTYSIWARFRLPITATTVALMLVLFSWVSRYYNFHVLTGFPLSFTFPSTYIGIAILLDATLAMTRSLLLSSIFGGLLYGALIFPLNWPLFAAYFQPVEYSGILLSVADLMGYEYIRTTTPEYLRIIEESTLRTFGGSVTPLTAVFAGFVSVFIYGGFLMVGALIDKYAKSIRRLV